MSKTNRFVIRTYGLVINKNNEILISDEFELGIKMTKFPGGGLEFGEGLIDGLKREFMEECNGQVIENVQHFYTTDFYQKALFYDDAQLISVYFMADLVEPLCFDISGKAFDFEIGSSKTQSFRWVKIKDLNEDEITFPIDKFVVQKLKQAMDA